MADPETGRALFEFEQASGEGGGSRRTLADGRAAAEVLLRRLNTATELRGALLPAEGAPQPHADTTALLTKFGMDVVLNINWYERSVTRLKRRWRALQAGLWGAMVLGFVGMIWLSTRGAMSEDPNAWVPLLSAFGTFGFGLLQTVQASTNQKGRLSAYRTASSALKTLLYELEDAWIDRLKPGAAEDAATFGKRLHETLLPALDKDLDARVRAARKVLRDEQAQSFDAESAPDALAKALPERLKEAQGLLTALPAVTDPNRAQREQLEKGVEDARAAVAKAEGELAEAEAGLVEAKRLGVDAAALKAQEGAVNNARISLAGKRQLLLLAEAAVKG